MLIAFTICSNNYLPYARILAESFRMHNPEHRFIIGLVDKYNDAIDYSDYSGLEILEVAEIGIPGFGQMVERYNIVELNTAVKPFYFKYFFGNTVSSELKVIYFDPDIQVFSSISPIYDTLKDCDILLTPHIQNPIPLDDHYPNERLFLTYGIYNLGFLALRKSPNTDLFLTWWSERLMKLCYSDVVNGLYVDQLWMNLVPLFFEQCKVFRHMGANVAFWNLHERNVHQNAGTWVVNSESLLFFHFSSVTINDASLISRFSTRFNLDNYPQLLPLFDFYRAQLRAFGLERLKKIPCYYVLQRELILRKKQTEFYRRNPHRWLIRKLKRLIPGPVREFLTK